MPAMAAMNWPGKRPAGISSLQMSYNRFPVSTTAPRPRNLPPINDKTRPGQRKSKSNAKTQKRERSSLNSSTENSEQKAVLGPLRDPRISSDRRNSRIFTMNEKEAMFFKRLKGIYANSTDTTVRAKRIQTDITSLQSRTLHSEIEQSVKDYKKKVESDKRNRSELKRVRERYSKGKERRNRRSYVSLNALECPLVSRHAYGLPEEGKELETGVTQSGQKELRDIWHRAMKRATIVSKLVNMKQEKKHTLPEIIVRSKLRKPKRNKEPQKDSFTDAAYSLEMVLGEIDAMSTVLSESEEDDLQEEDDE